jgi:hypothetical protein
MQASQNLFEDTLFFLLSSSLSKRFLKTIPSPRDAMLSLFENYCFWRIIEVRKLRRS